MRVDLKIVREEEEDDDGESDGFLLLLFLSLVRDGLEVVEAGEAGVAEEGEELILPGGVRPSILDLGNEDGLITSKLGFSFNHCSKLTTLGATDPVKIFPVLRSITGTGVSSIKLAGLTDGPSTEIDFLR